MLAFICCILIASVGIQHLATVVEVPRMVTIYYSLKRHSGFHEHGSSADDPIITAIIHSHSFYGNKGDQNLETIATIVIWETMPCTKFSPAYPFSG